MILVISSQRDEHAQAVMGALRGQGDHEVRLLDLSEFPMRLSLAMRVGNNGDSGAALQSESGQRIDMRQVTAVWWRRPQPFSLPPELKDPAHRHFAASEAATAFQGMWQASTALWVNDTLRDAAASHKSWQLGLARQLGLTVPETLITNNPDEARAFWRQHAGQVVYKAFSASYFAWRETRVLRPEEEALAETIRLAPVIFQRYVTAVADLRITAIGPRLFAAAADTRQVEYAADVRLNHTVRYEPHRLPEHVEQRLLSLMRRLGLEYGAIDMRLTPEGEYVFLEVNPAGQFLYVEHATGLPLSAELARHLAAGVPTPP